MPAAYPVSYCQVIDRALKQYFPPTDTKARTVYEAMAYSLFSGGKRLRPILVLLAAEAVGGDSNTVLPAACAVEYLHTYSLIHDDLPAMDNDSLRRGQPTCHVKFGEDIAILAGDGFLAEAFVLIATEQSIGRGDKALQVIAELSEAVSVRGMVGGQAADILQTGIGADIETIEHIHSLKTGKLITAAARCGAILAGSDEAFLGAITDYAVNLGLAFQITDDILDVVGTTKLLGKNIGSDVKLSKATFPAVLGLEKSKEFARRAIGKAKAALNDGTLMNTDALLELAEFILNRQS